MKTFDMIQGSPEWQAHRAQHFNASDAPAMMGCSPYKTRDQLLRELHTGLGTDVDAATQRRFDAGHRFEALARPLAEQIVGQDLFPVVGTEGPYSASFDGLTMGEDIAFEHKSLNDDLRECMESDDDDGNRRLPLHYRVQMEQQLMICDGLKVLFMASKWAGDSLVEERHCWYHPDQVLRGQIIAGWDQFKSDLDAYVLPEAANTAPAGKAPETLPALRIEVTGMVTHSNLAEFKATALGAIKSVNRDLKTDQDFADAEQAVKWCGEVESRLEAAKDHALSQTSSIDALFKTIDDISAEARKVRLDLEKLVKARKDSIRGEIVSEAVAVFAAHVREANVSVSPMQLPIISADFGGVIKGKRTVASIRSAVDTELARVKVQVNETAGRIRVSLNMLEQHSDKAFLFNDRQALVLKAPDDLAAVITNRLAEHSRKESERLEAERERIRIEEQAKAQREANARAAAEARRQAEQQQAEQRAAAQRLAEEHAAFERVREEGRAAVAAAEAATQARQAIIQAAAAPLPAPTQATLLPATAPSSVDEPPTLKLGTICERLSFTVSADFMVTLGYSPKVEKGARLFHEADFVAICRAISAHVLAVAKEHDRVTS
jgi:putative phage-type endonuclease